MLESFVQDGIEYKMDFYFTGGISTVIVYTADLKYKIAEAVLDEESEVIEIKQFDKNCCSVESTVSWNEWYNSTRMAKKLVSNKPF